MILVLAAYAYNQQNKSDVEAPAYFTVTPTPIIWGNVTWYQTATINITNTLNQTSSKFNMTHNAPDYLRLYWDFENQTLQANATRMATFTLYRIGLWNESKTFSFTITLRG